MSHWWHLDPRDVFAELIHLMGERVFAFQTTHRAPGELVSKKSYIAWLHSCLCVFLLVRSSSFLYFVLIFFTSISVIFPLFEYSALDGASFVLPLQALALVFKERKKTQRNRFPWSSIWKNELSNHLCVCVWVCFFLLFFVLDVRTRWKRNLWPTCADATASTSPPRDVPKQQQHQQQQQQQQQQQPTKRNQRRPSRIEERPPVLCAPNRERLVVVFF